MGQTFTGKVLGRLLCGVWLLLVAGPGLAQDISSTKPAHKLAPGLSKVLPQKNAQTSVRVQVKNVPKFQEWLKANLPQPASISTKLPNTFLFQKLSSSQLSLLAECPWVTFVDVAERKPQEEAYLQNSDLRVNRVEALHLAYPEVHGQGLVASVKEQPFDTADIDFKGRILFSEAFKQASTPHATSMATLVAGGGNSSPGGKGVAWKSRLTAADFSNLLPDDLNQLKSQGVTVQNHSYGVGVENYYGLESQAYDQQSLQAPELLHVFSSGNAGTAAPADGPYANLKGFANLTGQFKISKSSLSVGAVDTSGQVSLLSSRGPAYDGRIKPELVAFGEAGTSEAASVVSGIALLVQDAYKKQKDGALPSSALVRAALINSADDKGAPEVDYAAGFGNADALGAVQSILQNRFYSGTVRQGSIDAKRITVPPGTAKVKVTLVWQDAEGLPNAPKALINDLDLVLKEVASGQQWLPWGLSTYAHKDSLEAPARRQPDHVNNVEQITLAAPATGEFEIQVRGFHGAGELPFSVVYEFEKAFSWAYPTAGSHLEGGQKNRLRWLAPVKNGATGILELRWEPGGTWQTIRQNVPLSTEAVDVTLPDTAALASLRMVLGSASYETGPVVVSPSPILQVGYQCGEEVMLYWPKAPGASAYQVYGLGAQYLEPLVQTEDTVVVLKKSQNPGVFYAVAPIVQGKEGQRSLTLNYTQQGVGCYIKNFLARQYVTDTVQLTLEISTSLGLQAMFLERRVNGVFQTVQPIKVGQQTEYLLEDALPQIGFNEYRIKVVTQKGEVFYSQPERIVFTTERSIQVYPNPSAVGEGVNIITQDEDTNRILIYDQVGRLVREVSEDGAVKVIDTKGLAPGVYFLKVFSSTGTLIQSRFILL
ncbi:S8 family serine peptidase [Sabulibacter ruber]|uniref:S8 family serine peptidase n=1 Tax=Sabulibacter ruber TaxID=2811901 RepID=UPI001A97B8BC|nr:S8 family serine peptidase [Sabulibacter ruber]